MPIGAIFGRFRTVDVGGAVVISGAETKAPDPGGIVWPPRSNSQDNRTALKKKHLIEVAPFGRLDQMLRTTVQGGWGSVGVLPQPS